MRRMSFSATVEQMRNQTKTVTRRHPDTWQHLEPGDQVLAIEKGTGLAKGKKQVPIGVIEIVHNDLIPLEPAVLGWRAWLAMEARREGFATWDDFREAWRQIHGRYDPAAQVRRIEFRHLEVAS